MNSGSDELKLLRPAHLVPVRPAGVVHTGHSVVIRGERIVETGPDAELVARYPHAEQVNLSRHALFPGFINMHSHSPMTLLRGYADDLPLQTWLEDHIWPAEQEFVGPAFVTDGATLAVAEMLRGGTTCFNDMYFHPETVASVCRQAGIRASIGVPLIEHDGFELANGRDYFDRARELYERWQSEPLLDFTLTPHAPYSVGDDSFREVLRLSDEFGLRVHTHLLETDWDIIHSRKEHGQHPLGRMQDLGLLNERLQAVHMTHLTPDDMELLAATSTHVVHCPQSNLKLASGMCPVAQLLQAGINVSIGTDGAASNNNLDILSEAQTAALLAKGVTGSANSVTAFQVLEMITINGAYALGREDRLGSIEPGKLADLVAVDFDYPETQPLHNVVSQLIYSASSHQVTDVWVNGSQLLRNRELTTLDLEEILGRAQMWKARLGRFHHKPGDSNSQ